MVSITLCLPYSSVQIELNRAISEQVRTGGREKPHCSFRMSKDTRGEGQKGKAGREECMV
jgi:hypothetical protein